MAKTLRVEGVSEAVDAMMSAEAWMTVTVTRQADGTHMLDLHTSNPIALHALVAFANNYADEWLTGGSQDPDDL